MHIKLLGTASAEGWPGMFCPCDICRRSREVGGKNLRSRSSALIDGVLKIDFPPDTQHHVLTQNLDLTQIKYLLFTHGHDDHFAVRELQYMSWMFVPEPARTPLQVLAPQDVIEEIQENLNLDILPLALHCLTPWETITFDDWAVTPIIAQHDPKRLCFNYLITRREADGTTETLLYATDTGWYDPPTWAFLGRQKIDGMVLECTKGPVEGGYMAHLCIPEVVRMQSHLVKNGVMAPGAPVVTTHHSHLGGLMHDELEAHLNPHGVQVGYDGMEWTL